MVGERLTATTLGELVPVNTIHSLEALGMNCRTRDTGTMRPPAECLQHAALAPFLRAYSNNQSSSRDVPGLTCTWRDLAFLVCEGPRILHLITALVPIFTEPAA